MGEKVSVIVPIFRTEKYLRRCIESIVNQQYKNIEIILVNDGSDDNSIDICREYTKCKNVILINKNNEGLSSARNAGLNIATGDYVVFVDSDDYISESYISRVHELINKYDADIAGIKYKEVFNSEGGGNLSKSKEIVYISPQEVKKAFFIHNVTSVCVFMYRRRVIDNIRFEVGKTSEDIMFNFQVFNKVKTLVFSNDELYYYYYNPKSISNGCVKAHMLDYLEMKNRILEKVSDKELLIEAEASYARAAMGIKLRSDIFGIDKDINQNVLITELNTIFDKNKSSFYKSKSIPWSRKCIAIMIFNANILCKPILRFLGTIYDYKHKTN